VFKLCREFRQKQTPLRSNLLHQEDTRLTSKMKPLDTGKSTHCFVAT